MDLEDLKNQKIQIKGKNGRLLIQQKTTLRNKAEIDNLKYLIYYTLLQIVYIDNLYSIYLILKKKYIRYLIRIY